MITQKLAQVRTSVVRATAAIAGDPGSSPGCAITFQVICQCVSISVHRLTLSSSAMPALVLPSDSFHVSLSRERERERERERDGDRSMTWNIYLYIYIYIYICIEIIRTPKLGLLEIRTPWGSKWGSYSWGSIYIYIYIYIQVND